MIPERMPQLPKAMFRTPCHIVLNQEGLSEDGEQLACLELDLKCCFSEKRKQIMNAEKQIIYLEGSAVLLGDIAPALPNACTGTFTVAGVTYSIYSIKRPRNPDGSVHHTSLELM